MDNEASEFPKPMRHRVVFLDIDGPIVTDGMFFVDGMCSIQRTICNGHAIGWLNATLEAADAWLVTNTTHNTHDVLDPITFDKRTIKDDLIRWGVPRDRFHPTSYTSYPYPPHTPPLSIEYEKWKYMHPRQKAVSEWLEKFGPNFDWVAFDDEPFNKDFQVLIDPLDGIGSKEHYKACEIFNVTPKKVWLS